MIPILILQNLGPAVAATNMDTADKRFSIMQFCDPLIPLVLPSGGIDTEAERRGMLGLYFNSASDGSGGGGSTGTGGGGDRGRRRQAAMYFLREYMGWDIP